MKHIKLPITYHLMSGAHDRIDDQAHVPIADCWIPGVAREFVQAANYHDRLFAIAKRLMDAANEFDDEMNFQGLTEATEMARDVLEEREVTE